VLFFVLRWAIVVLTLWLLWRLLKALFPARRSPRIHRQDEWAKMLEEIEELPETTDPHPDADDGEG
jgi:hypothetical protein